MTTSTPLPEQGGDVPTGLDEAVRMFKGYVRGENGFDELDFKEWLIEEWHNKQVEEVLDRLEGENSIFKDYKYKDGVLVGTEIVCEGIPLSAIEAERKKLKEN